MLKDYVAPALFVWTVLWTVGSTVAHIFVARSRAAKTELAAISALIETKAERVRVDGHETKLIAHDRRIQKTESDLQGLPTLSLFHDLALELRELRGDLKTIEATLKTNTEMTRRIDDALFDGRK